jgi:hypothetical protein
MKTFRLSVFTEPIKAEGFLQRIRSVFSPLKYFLKGDSMPVAKKYGGHYAVTRSLIEGLRRTTVDFNYNPQQKNQIAENVIVLAGVDRLKQMITLKNQGHIKKLIAGPNVVEDVRSEDAIVANPAVDHYLVPSDWVRALAVNDCPDLENRVRTWAAGIDTDNWQPSPVHAKTCDALIYWKTEPLSFYQEVVKVLDEKGLKHLTIKYGNYAVDEFKEKLGECRFVISISRSESQGIAMFEAWAMDVPTLVFDPGEFIFHGRKLTNVSSCPYLSHTTGKKWKTVDELSTMLDNRSALSGFAPRHYVVSNFTDKHSADRLISLFKN